MNIQDSDDEFREKILEAFYKFYKGNAIIKNGPRFKISAIDIWKETSNMLGRTLDIHRDISPALNYFCDTRHIKFNKKEKYYSITPKGISHFEGKSKFIQGNKGLTLQTENEIETPAFDFIHNNDLMPILIRDYTEVGICIKSECWKSAIILCGSAIEAILYDLLKQNESAALNSKTAPKSKGNVLPLEEWKLNSLINTASELSLVSKGVEGLSHTTREFRNLIHPLKEISGAYKLEKEEAENAFTTLKILIRDLTAERISRKPMH